MTREEKPVRLRPINEDNDPPKKVVRLVNRDTESKNENEKPIRLGRQNKGPEVDRRLELPSREEVELRTHQPGIDVLIETIDLKPECLEEGWEQSADARNPIPWGWFVLVALIIFGAVAWSLSEVKKADVQISHVREETASVLVDDAKENLEASRLIDRMDRAVRDYFATTGVEALIRQVRHPERVGSLMKTYYGGKPIYKGTLKSIKMLQPMTLDNHGNFWMAKVSLSDSSTQNVVLEILESGEPKIDWETLVCYQPMGWDDFVSQRPTGQSLDFRIIVEEDSFFSHEFADSTRWMSYRLTAPGSEETLFGYAPAGQEIAQVIHELIRQNGGKQASLVLRLGIPEGIQSRRGVVIEKIISARWLFIESPDSGS